jgi:hypothetical protein
MHAEICIGPRVHCQLFLFSFNQQRHCARILVFWNMILHHGESGFWCFKDTECLTFKGLIFLRTDYSVMKHQSCRELFKELNTLTLSSHYINSFCYCLLLIIQITLFQIVYIITLMQDKKIFTLASGISGRVSEGSLLFQH